MKIIFFSDPEFRGSDLEREVVRCGVRVVEEGRLTLILVEDVGQERCVKRLLVGAVEHYEMEGVPRMLKYVSLAGKEYAVRFV